MSPKGKTLLISTGDPAGVGPEISLQALREAGSPGGVRLVAVGDFSVMKEAASRVGLSRRLVRLESLDVSPAKGDCVEILHVALEEPAPLCTISAEAGKHVFELLACCSRMCLEGRAAGVVTAPINKESLERAGHGGKGHTEILAELSGVSGVETVFIMEGLRIFFLSRHVSLQDAIGCVRKDRILRHLTRMHRILQSAGVERPRLGVPGLNPHCGDGGAFGREEIEEIEPAVRAAQEQGLRVEGPIGADSIYHLGLQGRFDGVLSLYHDQGHIAAKTRDFYGTVTQTFGLPYLRTSVDHGTGFDIAWTGKANAESMIRAVDLAVNLVRR